MAQLMAISYTNSADKHEDDHKETSRKKRRLEVGAFGMHLHFANLVDEQLTDMIISDGKLKTGNIYWRPKCWRPTCCFSAIDEDIYFDLESLENYSTRYIFAVTKTFSVHESTKAVTNDYKIFENMVAHAIFCSSRRNGVGGIPFNDFFACLLGEFQDIDLLKDYSADVQRLSSTIIPFLAPPNAEWPKWILDQNSSGCNFGHLVRARNNERCDIYVQDADIENEKPIFICECNYWGTNVDMIVMDQIIDGLNQKWKWEVVFMFCMTLAKFRTPLGHRSVDCVKINYRDGKVIWIFQPAEITDRQQLLIVFEIGGQDRPDPKMNDDRSTKSNQSEGDGKPAVS
ncbi:hypothetical protein Plhal304r1_c010g0039631 [Plasmopara halstedii]